jgi:outer membrane protein assembly factor BamB
MFGSQETNISTVDDTYGFEKTLILLTKQGKVFAVSSLTGKILWKFFKPS